MKNVITFVFLVIVFLNFASGATLKVRQQGVIQLLDTDNSNYVELQAPGTVSSNLTFILPSADGSSGQYLQTDGSGTLSFSTPSTGDLTVTSKTTTYTATTSDSVILADTSGAGWTLTLYATSGNSGKTLYIKKTTSDTNVLTIDANASETIDGQTTMTIDNQYEFIKIVNDGSNWHVITQGHDPVSPVRYTTDAGQSIPNNTTTTVDYEDVSYDDDSLVTTGTWVYTCPSTGKYEACAYIEFADSSAWTTGERVEMRLELSGGFSSRLDRYEVPASGTLIVAVGGCGSIDCDATETMRITTTQNSGSTISLNSTSGVNHVTIKRLE